MTRKQGEVLTPVVEQPFYERHWLLLIAAVTLLGVGLRCYGLANRSLWYDEACSIWGSTFVNWHLDFLNPWRCREMPLSAFTTKLWYPVVDLIPGVQPGSAAFDFLLRLLPCAISTLIIPTTFLLARWLLRDTVTSLVAAFLIAISPFQIYYAQELRPHGLFTLATAAATYCMLRAFDEDRLRYWIWTAVWMAVALWAYYMAVFYFIGMNVLFFANFNRWKQHFWKGVFTEAVAGLLMLPAILLAHTMLKYQQLATEFYFPFPTPRTAAITLKNFLAGYSPNAHVYLPLFALAALFCVLSLWKFRTNSRAGVALLVLTFVPLIANILFWYTQGFPYYTHRAQLPCSVPFAILIAMGISALRRPALIGTATALMAALTVPTLADHYAQRMHASWDHRMGARFPIDLRDSAEYIRTHMQAGDVVANASHFTQASYQYHYLPVRQHVLGFTEEDSKGLFKGNADEEMWKTTGWIPVRIESAIEGAQRVWLVTSWWEPYNLPSIVHDMRSWFDGHGVRLDHKQFQGLEVYLYDMSPELRARTARNTVLDRGSNALYFYSSANAANVAGVADAGLRKDWDYFEKEGSVPFSADFGLQLIEPKSLARADLVPLVSDGKTPVPAAALPVVSGESYSGTVRIKNNSDTGRAVQGTVYEPLALLDALSFERAPNEDVWRPQPRVNFGGSPPTFADTGYAAHLKGNIRKGSLTLQVPLSPGSYDVYVHLAEECLPKNEYRAFLYGSTVAANGSSVQIGKLSAHRTQGVSGWRWRRLGTMSSAGGNATLVLTASNDDNLADAYFDFDRVMLLAAGTGIGEEPRSVAQFQIALAPHETRPVRVEGKIAGAATKQIAVEIEDLDSHELRRLFSQTVRPAGK